MSRSARRNQAVAAGFDAGPPHTLERVNRPSCPFCNLPPERVLLETETTLSFFDAHPVSEGHALVVPKRYVASVFSVPSDELESLWKQVAIVRRLLAESYNPDAFNVGVNDGLAAGQTVPHSARRNFQRAIIVAPPAPRTGRRAPARVCTCRSRRRSLRTGGAERCRCRRTDGDIP